MDQNGSMFLSGVCLCVVVPPTSTLGQSGQQHSPLLCVAEADDLVVPECKPNLDVFDRVLECGVKASQSFLCHVQ